MKISDSNIILTGASAGIGLEVLKLLAQHKNVKIIAVARHTENIPMLDGIIYPYSADLSTREGIDSVFNYAKEIFENIDIFVANAGFAYLERLDNADWEHNQYIFDLNVFSPIYSLQKMAELNQERQIAFVATISGAGLATLPGYSLYCSTKAALHHFLETYRYEKPKNIQITSIYPVATRTNFFDKATGVEQTPLPFPQQKPTTVAKAIVRGIEKGKKRVYPSLLFRIFYPIGRAFPFMLKIYSLNEKRKVNKFL